MESTILTIIDEENIDLRITPRNLILGFGNSNKEIWMVE